MEELPKRKPNRLNGYNYSRCGAYFITICTQEKRKTLSQICRGGALLLPTGVLLDAEINRLQGHYELSVDKYVIMPNHVHMIFTLPDMREEQSPSPTISDVVCAFKSTVTKAANKSEGTPGRQIFQRSFHDHIIRDERDYHRIWDYIDTNPLKWEDDCFYVS